MNLSTVTLPSLLPPLLICSYHQGSFQNGHAEQWGQNQLLGTLRRFL